MSSLNFEIPASSFYLHSMQHSPAFLKLVNDAKSRITEISIETARARLATNPHTVLVDVREEGEWAAGHAAEAKYLGKGIFERDLEKLFPDPEIELIMYCGGGFRSALTCDAAQMMGYKKVRSLAGGYKAMVAAGWPMTK
jgi:rhodanese-related sulfurtransferase